MKSSPVALSLIASGLLSVGMLATSLTAIAVAGEVYQWKDAKGVTQYSSMPPPKGTYKVRTINNAGAANAAVTTTAKTDETPRCVQALNNVAALRNKGPVRQDSDGDGKLDKTMTDSERTTQLALAQAVINTDKCTATAATSATK